MEDPTQITYIGKVDYRNKLTRFGIKAKDRTKHMYVIGKTGTGKSTFLENMIVQDIQNGNGVAFIDPHGQSAEKILDYIPEWRVNDVIYLNPSDINFPVAFNPLEDMGPDKRHLIADGLMSVFEKIWPEAFSGRATYILNNTMLALLESPDSAMMGINRMLTDKEFRKKIVANVTDPAVKNVWETDLLKWDDKRWGEAVGTLINKVGQFTSNPIIRNIIGQPKSSFDFRKAMDERKIIIMNLSKGMIGEQNAPLIGALLITKIYLAAMSRSELPGHVIEKMPSFYFYVDEFQNFANDSFADILSEARKYKLALTVANQYIMQMDEKIRDAVFGNMGTTIAFRVGPLDAEFMERVFAPVFTQEDLQNIAFGQYYVTLQIDGMGSKPFSAQGLGPIPPLQTSMREHVIAASRAQFATPRAEIEAKVMEWYSPTRKPEPVRTDNRGDAPRSDYQKRSPQNERATPRPIQSVQPKPLPLITGYKNPEPKEVREIKPAPKQEIRVEKPKAPSATLQNLLNKLDEKMVVEEKPVDKKFEPSSQRAISKPPQKELTRAASPEKKSALQEALAKAMMEAQVKKDPVAPTPLKPAEEISKKEELPKQEVVHEVKSVEIPVPASEPQPSASFIKTQTRREVPEDILRSVLE